MAGIVKENLGDGQLNPFELESIHIPTGGSTKWAIPGLGKEELVESFQAILVFWHDVRARWLREFGSGGEPPVCSSLSGQLGVGKPGGNCQTCKYAQFGSSEKAGSPNAQWCKAIRRLYLLRKGNQLPILLPLPPTSLKSCRSYFMRLTNAGVPYYGVVSEFRLEKATNAAGVAYAQIAISAAVKDEEPWTLSPEEMVKVKRYSDSIKEALLRAPVRPDEYKVTPEDPEEQEETQR
jgi:hypothetical protein